MKIAQVDVHLVRLDHHYKVAGHTETPGRLPGTDYYIEPQWPHAYSRVMEACLVKVTADNGTVGWGEAYGSFSSAVVAAIDQWIAPLAVGQKVDDVELPARIERTLHNLGRAGATIITAEAEYFAGPGQDARADRGVVARRAKHRRHLGGQSGRQAVAVLRPVQRQHRDSALARGDNRRHAFTRRSAWRAPRRPATR